MENTYNNLFIFKFNTFCDAMLNSVGTLVYSKFLRDVEVRNKEVYIPSFDDIRKLLSIDSLFMRGLVEHIPTLFRDNEHISVDICTLEEFITPTFVEISDIIEKKFDFPHKTKRFYLASEKSYPMFYYKYIARETVLQMLLLECGDSFEKTNERTILMKDLTAVSVDHENALCQIVFDKSILDLGITSIMYTTGSNMVIDSNGNTMFTTDQANEVSILTFRKE